VNVNYTFEIQALKSKMDYIIKIAVYRLQILAWRDSLIKYGMTNDYFASQGFTPD
jgi:hypothetical protein